MITVFIGVHHLIKRYEDIAGSFPTFPYAAINPKRLFYLMRNIKSLDQQSSVRTSIFFGLFIGGMVSYGVQIVMLVIIR